MFNAKRIERIGWVDAGKGLGLLFVVLGHLLTAGSSLAVWIFSFHIPLFFFLSGYVSNFTVDSNYKSSLRKIFVTLIVPYFIFVLIGLIASIIVPGWLPKSLSKVIFEVFYLAQPESLHVGQLWFLFCLAVVQVFFLIFLKFNLNNKYVILGLIFLFSVISYFMYKNNIGLLTEGGRHYLPWKIDSAFMGLFFFSLGYYSRLVGMFSRILSFSSLNKLLLIVIAFVINIYFVGLNDPTNLGANMYGNLFYYIFASVSGVIFAIMISMLLINVRVILYMGKNAISIFSSHSFILFFYAYILGIAFQRNFKIMDNIPLALSFVGLFFSCLVLLFIPVIYSNTIQKMLLKFK